MNKEAQKNIFDLFHDGSFQNFRRVGKNIEFEIAIEYLAQAVNPNYTLFKVTMINCQQLVLDIWDEEKTADIDEINAIADDFEILSAFINPEGYVSVCCDAFSRSGGYLLFACDTILLFDECGTPITAQEIAMHVATIGVDLGKMISRCG